MPLDISGMKEVGKIYQDLTTAEAPVIVVFGSTAYLMDVRTLHGRILKWNTQKISITEQPREEAP